KGWRRLARIVTSQQEYVDAVLAVSAIDTATSIVLSSRANVGGTRVAAAEKEVFIIGSAQAPPPQVAIENSLDAALTEAFHRTMEGLAALPFKAVVLSAEGGVATIAFGQNVGIRPGTKFALLSVDATITNAIGDTYQVMGAPIARLKVTSVSENQATLQIEEGSVAIGDIIQAVR
ncbi:MAG: hypothetical protein ACRCTY_02420, partial [Candidatus Adiutrix sp.]